MDGIKRTTHRNIDADINTNLWFFFLALLGHSVTSNISC